MTHSIGSGESFFQCNRNVFIALGALLVITGVAMTTLGAMGALGELKGVGAITSMTLGGLDVLAVLAICLRAIVCRKSNKIVTTTCTKEKLERVKWHCSTKSSQERLGVLYTPNNELNESKWKKYSFASDDKLIVVFTLSRVAYHTIGEPCSPEFDLVTREQETLGERLLVLIDIEAVRSTIIEKEPRNMISKAPVWGQLFSSNRCLCTNDPDWRTKLEAFIAS